jgi:hypothetical protein
MLFIKEDKVPYKAKKIERGVVVFLSVIILVLLFADLFFGIVYVGTSGIFNLKFLEGVLSANLVILFLIVVVLFVLTG